MSAGSCRRTRPAKRIDAGAAAYIGRRSAEGLQVAEEPRAVLQRRTVRSRRLRTSAYGAAFTALPPQQQDAVLSDIESGKATGFTPSSDAFFRAIHEHTLQGMFGDPVYGGNKNFAGWDLIGYPGVKSPLPQATRSSGHGQEAHKSTYANGQFAKAKKEALA